MEEKHSENSLVIFSNANAIAFSVSCTNKISEPVRKGLRLCEHQKNRTLSCNCVKLRITLTRDISTTPFDSSYLKFSINVYIYIVYKVPHYIHHVELYHSKTKDQRKEYILNKLKNS